MTAMVISMSVIKAMKLTAIVMTVSMSVSEIKKLAMSLMTAIAMAMT